MEKIKARKAWFLGMCKEKALSLEQLRDMDGNPVWVEDLKNHDRSAWRLIYWDRGKYLVMIAKSSDGYILEEYGQTWIAYAYPPARIDREAWEQCQVCECERVIFRATAVPDFPCGGTDIGGHAKFCPECGRPLTPEAWAELEKRLRW